MSRWGWSYADSAPVSDPAPAWLRTLSTVSPFLCVAILFMMLWTMCGAPTSREGILFYLPDAPAADVAEVSMSVLVVPGPQGTLVFFDDTRYVFDDERQMDEFSAQLERRMSCAREPVLLVLADRRVKGGELMKLAGIAKSQGARKILFAEKSNGRKGR